VTVTEYVVARWWAVYKPELYWAKVMMIVEVDQTFEVLA
jgi:hypothetical protein